MKYLKFDVKLGKPNRLQNVTFPFLSMLWNKFTSICNKATNLYRSYLTLDEKLLPC